jgi:nucleoside-diphosphate-sugar epimerase
MKQVILLTGANGFLGSACVDFFNSRNKEQVIALWNNGSEKLSSRLNDCIIYEQCDLLDIDSIDSLFKKYSPTTIIHTAALLPDGKPDYLSRASAINILATSYLVNKAVEYSVNLFVYCSTTSVYGYQPCGHEGWKEDIEIKTNDIYSWSKWCGEEALRLACQTSALKGLTLRLSGIHGPKRSSGVVFNMFKLAKNGYTIQINNNDRFQLIFIDEAINIIIMGLSINSSYEVVNAASHTIETLQLLSNEIISICGSDSVTLINDKRDFKECIMNTKKLSILLSYQPKPLNYHLMAIYEQFKSNS